MLSLKSSLGSIGEILQNRLYPVSYHVPNPKFKQPPPPQKGDRSGFIRGKQYALEPTQVEHPYRLDRWTDWRMNKDYLRRQCVIKHDRHSPMLETLHKNITLPLETRELDKTDVEETLPPDANRHRLVRRCAISLKFGKGGQANGCYSVADLTGRKQFHTSQLDLLHFSRQFYSELGKQTPKLYLSFKCTVCNGTNSYTISKQAYNHGVVLVTCKTCSNNHLIADNLGWFDDVEGKNIEEILEKKGEKVVKFLGSDVKEIEPEEIKQIVDK